MCYYPSCKITNFNRDSKSFAELIWWKAEKNGRLKVIV